MDKFTFLEQKLMIMTKDLDSLGKSLIGTQKEINQVLHEMQSTIEALYKSLAITSKVIDERLTVLESKGAVTSTEEKAPWED